MYENEQRADFFNAHYIDYLLVSIAEIVFDKSSASNRRMCVKRTKHDGCSFDGVFKTCFANDQGQQ